MRMSRTLLTGVALTATLGIAACHNPPDTPTAPLNATTPPTSAPSTSATPNTYKAVTKPCDVVDFRPLETVLGKSTGNPLPQKPTATGLITFMTCSRSLGPATARTTVLVEMDTFKGVSAEAQYHGLRTVQERSMPVTEVPGLGQGAYTRINDADKSADPRLAEVLTATAPSPQPQAGWWRRDRASTPIRASNTLTGKGKPA